MTSDVIGIDLGTTHSCVAIYSKGKLEVLENDHGLRTTPSYVAFTQNEIIVGNEAKLNTCIDPSNTVSVFDTKRMIGLSFDDSCIQRDLKYWPFKVSNNSGKPMIKVMYKNAVHDFVPEQISAMLLTKMKELAEEKTGNDVTSAVITVPAYFNDSQRQATKDAARIAGLSVSKLVNEPTAAALAFTYNKHKDFKANVLVFDLGGGTFDVSVIAIDNGAINVKAVNGDTHLGGLDFDVRLVEHFVDEVNTKYNIDLKQDEFKSSLTKLRCACEMVKMSLSFRLVAKIRVASLFHGTDFVSSITRAKFEDLCDDLFHLTLMPVENALKDAKVSKEDIDDVLLVGGSTRIPKVQSLLQEFFGGKKLNKSINPDEAVACGAAIQASLLQLQKDDFIANLSLHDVTPLSYGIGTLGGLFSVIIKRNTPYPVTETKFGFRTIEDHQTEVLFRVFQGERPVCVANQFLDKFVLRNMPSKWAGEVRFSVTMKIDENGILKVYATEQSTGIRKGIKIENANGKLTEAEIKQFIEKVERMKQDDEKLKQNIKARNKLQLLAYDLRRFANDEYPRKFHNENTRRIVRKKVDEVLKWFNSNPIVPIDLIEAKYEDLLLIKRK